MTLANVLLFSLGVAAIAAPLWVHLRLGRVKKRAVVSSLRLMKATPQTSKSPRRLIDIPLLLLRALVLLLVALGFGRLLIPGMRSEDAKQYAVFVVDVSGSMQAGGSTKVWNQAKERVLSAMDRLNPASRVAVVLSPSGTNRPEWETPSRAIDRVKGMTAGFGANRLGDSILEANHLLAAMPEDRPKVLHVVSDFQRSSLAGLDEVPIPSGVELQVAKVGEERVSNRGIAVTVAAAGATDVGIYAFNDGSGGSIRLKEGGNTRTLEVLPGQGGVRLDHSGKKGEWVDRTLHLEEDDALAADNTAHDVYQGQEPIPVWLWEPGGELPSAAAAPLPVPRRILGNAGMPQAASAPAATRRAYDQASYYIDRALQPSLEGERAAASRYRPLTLTEKNLEAALGEAGSAAAPRLLIVPATKNPPAALAQLAKRVVQGGGSVIFFGGAALDPASYESQFGTLLALKPGAPGNFKLSPALADIASTNPLWGGLDAASRRQLAKAPLRTRHAATSVPGSTVLAAYADGVPFIAEKREGKGGAYFVNTSADRGWGDWAASASLFVPSLHLLAARALGDEAFAAANAPVPAGEPVTLRLPPEFSGRSLKLGDMELPVGSDGRVAGALFDKPGVADLVLTDGTKAGRVAVNFPTSESVLESDPEPVVRQRLESLRQQGGGSVVRWENEEQGGLAWRLCLFLAALLLVIEPVIANHRNSRVNA